MKLRYYSEFKSLKENNYRLEIHSPLATYSEEVKLSSDPISVEYESESLYQALKLSNATISVFSDRVLTDLYTGENQGVEVRLYNLTENLLEWLGYLTPNLYSSDYVTDFDNIELQAIDTLSSLENIKYFYIDKSGTFHSFSDILFFLLDKADPNRLLNKVFIQKTNRLTKDSTACLFSESYIHERNFFDEGNEPITCREVLESLVQYYGMTAIQWRGAYYLIDYDYINRGSCDFFVYDRTDNSYVIETLENSVKNVLEIGVAESGGNISLGDVYNKVSVVANMNKIGSLSPDLMDKEDLLNQNEDKNKYYISSATISEEQYTLLTAFFKSKSNWELKKTQNIVYKGTSDTTIISQYDIDEVTIDNINDITKGVLFQKCDSYKNLDGEPSSIDWDTYLTFIDKQFPDKYSMNSMLSLKNKGIMLFNGGYFLLDATYKMSKHVLAHTILSQNDSGYTGINYHTQYGWKFSNTMIPCRLAIGDCYYDGNTWINYRVYNEKVERGYFERVYEFGFLAQDSTIYYYYDDWGYQKYIDETRYNALPSGTNRGTYIIPGKTLEPSFYYNYSGKIVWIPKEYYYECFLHDRFFMVHVNREGDAVFETEKNLTNTVSYKMNLIDSEDAQAIKLPDFVLTGELTLDIFAPNELGIPPQDDAGQICNAFHFGDISLKYTNSKSTYDIFNNKSDDSDTVYSNEINDNNITDADDVNLIINSYSKGVASYSNAATKIGDKFDYIEGIYSSIEDAVFLPERILIDKLFRHYRSPKFRYQNSLNRDFSILSRIKENSLKKTMVVDYMSINYANENCIVNLIEV